ncbi:helix-turn-helix domain-containing protein [Salipaludibacillus sp. CUR1]|uniref:PucR family transcriptional regulator n=1 Tax=Salipaludibacillus sp. CUR1 TaxID=2820003 RepID=UPI001E5F9C09|nr:helix-turn-helix domain-containing protein [Salipaludibacillus sp. CUR1]MCE7791296.1 helix-turn-helix domain-containing protein [Salipaludibacillus sp. CUR1]
MNVKEVVQELEQRFRGIKLTGKIQGRVIEDVYFMTPGEKTFRNILYILQSSSIPADIIEPELMLLVVEDEPLKPDFKEALLKKHCTIIYMPPLESIFVIFNQVKALFARRQLKVRVFNEQLKALLAADTLDRLLEVSGRLLQNPLIMINDDFKVVAYSTETPLTDEIWQRNLQNGFCSYEFITEVNRLIDEIKPIDLHEPFSLTCTASPVMKWVTRIQSENRHGGYLVVPVCSGDMDSQKLELLSQASKLAGYHLKQKKVASFLSYCRMEEKLLVDLVKKTIHSREELEQRQKAAKFPHTHSMRLLLISPEEVRQSPLPERKIKKTTLEQDIVSLFPDSYLGVHDNILISLMIEYQGHTSRSEGARGSSVQEEQKRFELDKLLKGHRCQGIISDFFSDLFTLPVVFERLLKTMAIGKRIRPRVSLMNLDELRFYELIDNFPDKERLESYCHPAVLKLLTHDQTYGTDYYDTLQLYLLHNQNLNLTAQKLFIHRNTMKNRMKKINEIINLDLTEGELIFQLGYTYKIHKYMDQTIESKQSR